jgi:hypothetical protein
MTFKTVGSLAGDTEFGVTYHLNNEVTGLEGFTNIRFDELSWENQAQIMQILDAHLKALSITEFLNKLSHK